MSRVALFTSSSISLPSIQYLLETESLAIVVLGPRQDADSLSLEEVLQQNRLPYFRYDAQQIDEMLKLFKQVEAELALALNFSERVPAEIRNFFPQDCYNIHASKLPQYRGASPLFWQIKNQESEGQLSLHKMEDEYDTGDVFVKQPFEISPYDTLGCLNTLIAQKSPELIHEFLTDFEELQPTPQEGLISEAPRVLDQDLLIDWQKMKSAEIVALARAANPSFGGARFFYKNSPISMLEASEVKMPNYGVDAGTILHIGAPEGLIVASQDGAICLEVVSLTAGVFTGLRFAEHFKLDIGEKLQ